MSDTSLLLPVSLPLRESSRFRSLTADRLRAVDLLILGLAGLAAAAATALLDFGIRVPGHAILRTVLPLALGMAFVPRRRSGLVMSASAGLGLMALRSLGLDGGGGGATTSLLLTGPLLDLASRWSRGGWRIYLAFAGAGLASNMTAFAVRWALKAGGAGRGSGGGRGLGEWQSQAIVTYAICGLLAGLISAVICFRATAARPESRSESRSQAS